MLLAEFGVTVCGCIPWMVHPIRWAMRKIPRWRDWVGMLGFAALIMGAVWSSLELAEIKPEPFGMAIIYFMAVVVEYAWLDFNDWFNL